MWLRRTRLVSKSGYKRLVTCCGLFLVLLGGSIGLDAQYVHNHFLVATQDTVQAIFLGAPPEDFASGQVLWLFLWFGYLFLPIVLSAGVTSAYQQRMFIHYAVRSRQRFWAYLWPLGELLLLQMIFLIFMGGTILLANQAGFFGSRGFTHPAFWLALVLAQILQLVIMLVIEGRFNLVIGITVSLSILFLSMLQVPFMPFATLIGSTFPTDAQLLGTSSYLLILICLLLLIQVIYMPGRWLNNGATH